MVTPAELKRFAAPLLGRNPDLVQIKRVIAFKPVRHILHGIHLGSSSSTDWVRPRWFAMPLFEPDMFIHFMFAAHIYPAQPGSWHFSDPEAPVALAEQASEIALPMMRQLRTIEEFYRFAMQDNFFHYGPLSQKPMVKIIIDAARGDFIAADDCSAILLDVSKGWWRDDHTREDYDRITRQLCPLIAARDRAGIARLLHEWEEGTVKKLKLEKVWEPSPFPVEMHRD